MTPMQPDRRRIPPAATIAAFLAATGTAAAACFLMGGNESLLLISLAFLTTAVPFGLAALDAPDRLIHPLSLVGLSMLLGVAGQTVYLSLTADPAVVDGLLSGVGQSGLTKGLLVIALATFCLAAGYLVAAQGPSGDQGRIAEILARLQATGIDQPSPRRVTLVLGTLVGISVVAFALYMPQIGIESPRDLLISRKRFIEVGDSTTSLGYLRLGISMAGVAFVVATYLVAADRVPITGPVGWLGGAGLALTVGAAFALSSRAQLFVTVTVAALTYVAARQREPRPAMIFALTIGAIAVLAALAIARESGRPGGDDRPFGVEPVVETAVSARQWMDVGPISAVVSRVPDFYPYQHGLTLISSLWAPVPRTIWPDKPPVRIGTSIDAPVFQFSHKRNSGDPPGFVAELWINGSWWAVAVGSFLFGWTLRAIESLFRLARTYSLAAVCYGALAATVALTLPRSDLTGSIIAFMTLLPFVLLALYGSRAPTSQRSGT